MNNVFTTLTQLRNRARFLSTQHNPILKAERNDFEGKINFEFIANVLGQYFGLVTEITSYLSEAAIIAEDTDWPNIARELVRNRAEEFGSRTGGVPHRTLFARAMRHELGILVERVYRNQDTHQFLNSLSGAFYQQHAEFSLGAIYALEDTAAPELVVVGNILALIHSGIEVNGLSSNNLAAQDRGRPANQLSLSSFLRMHIVDFEVGHSDGLKTAIEKDAPDMSESFAEGYEFVLNLMETWWENLAKT